MYRTWLNTSAYLNAAGTVVTTHPDCDSTPTCKIYSHAGVLIEEPAFTKCTVYFSTGHYKYPLNPLLYTNGNWYYDIINAVYTDTDGDTANITTDRRYFEWSFLGGDTDTDTAKGYNYNLMKQVKRYLEAHTNLMTAIGHTAHLGGSIDKINWAFTLRRLEDSKSRTADYPCITLDIKGQEKAEDIDNAFGFYRQGILEIKLWNHEAITNLVIWNDWIINYFDLSNNYKGLRLDSADGIFKTGALQGLRVAPSPEGGLITYDERYNLYCTGSRYIIKAGLLA